VSHPRESSGRKNASSYQEYKEHQEEFRQHAPEDLSYVSHFTGDRTPDGAQGKNASTRQVER